MGSYYVKSTLYQVPRSKIASTSYQLRLQIVFLFKVCVCVCKSALDVKCTGVGCVLMRSTHIHYLQCIALLQVLEELCVKNGWGSPHYNLHSTSSQNQSGEDVLFLFKITIPAICYSYMPTKLSRTVEEARVLAADHTLSNLGCHIMQEGKYSPFSFILTVVDYF